MAAPASRRWWIALLTAAGLLAGVTAALVLGPLHKANANPGFSPSPAAAGPKTCNVPDSVPLRAHPDAENPPVILWAVAPLKLFVDGEPAFSSPDEPRHFKVGEHTLRVDAPNLESLTTRFRLEPFVPALFHADATEGAGITLVRIGSVCASCEYPASAPKLDPERSAVPAQTLLEGAAVALRKDNWGRAVELLRQVPTRERSGALWSRLISTVYLDTLQPEMGRAALDGIPVADAHDLKGLLQDRERLVSSERERRQQVLLARWNRVTTGFGNLLGRFQPDAPVPTAAAAERFEKLSPLYALAARDRDTFGQEESIRAGEEALLGLVRDLRAARPDDCAFQAEVVATLVR